MISWWQQHMFPCALKYFFGIDCPLCGAQRSLLFLIKGRFAESFKLYPPLLFVLMLILFAVIYLLYPSYIKAKYLRYYSAFVVIVISVNYAIKIVTGNL